MSTTDQWLVDPTACEWQPSEPAPRPGSLTGTTVLLVDATLNKASSWGVGMLDAAGAVLTASGVARFEHESFDPLDVSPGELWVASVIDQCDAVIFSAGDCITCTSRATRNAILAERAGLPAAIVSTSATTGIVRAVSRSLGLPGLAMFEIPDSLFGLSRDAIAETAEKYLGSLPGALSSQ